MNLPIGVSLCASGKRFPCLSLLSFMVLNLMTLNSLPCFPGRVWVKKGLPELAMASRMVMSRKKGKRINSASMLRMKSRGGLRKRRYTEIVLCVSNWCLLKSEFKIIFWLNPQFNFCFHCLKNFHYR